MYEIAIQTVWEAYKAVKANKGSAGVDNQTLSDFEKNLESNIYKIWNRMSSGSYCPPPVRLVEIAKSDGKVRQLGIPTVADRIAQMVAKMHLEPLLEPYFHEDSYGYRPKRSAHDALAKARKRCWRYDWVIDLDIKGFFDNLDHELVMKAVKKRTDCKWLHLYIRRWLTAPVQLADGVLVERSRGTPQGGVISPLLANLFLHYALDEWMKRKHPSNPFERYADDCVIHCTSLTEAENLKRLIENRLLGCRLECHPDKTKIVYCQDSKRQKTYSQTQFDFLGYTFKQREAKGKGEIFWSFLPAISKKAVKAISQQMKSWQLQRRSGSGLEAIAKEINPVISGWLNYYGKFYKSALMPLLNVLNKRLARWAKRKHKRLRHSLLQSIRWIERIAAKEPRMFVHWQYGYRSIFGQ